MPEYIVTAHSLRANTTQREINLMSSHPSTEQEAQRFADSFALRLNQQQFLSQTDWHGRIELVSGQGFRTL